MRSRNYTKEIGLNTEEPRVPAMASAVIFVLLVILALLFARQVNALQHTAAEPVRSGVALQVLGRVEAQGQRAQQGGQSSTDGGGDARRAALRAAGSGLSRARGLRILVRR